MKIIETTDLTIDQKETIRHIWNQEYPEKLRHNELTDLDQYLNNLTNKTHFLLTDEKGMIGGWCMVFDRDNERWFVIILDSNMQGKGYGKMLLNEIRKKENKLNGWLINHDGDVKQNRDYYRSPRVFYLKNGFVLLPDIRFESEKMSAIKMEWILR